jgi:phosphoenolpyruvate-protein kinase (PTS system EI component)
VPEIKFMANLDRAHDVGQALAAKAEGIGLYRTEMEVLYADRFLTEPEQEAKYRQVAAAMGSRPLCIRLLDLGADKAPAWLKQPAEANPALGCRGARLLLAHPELLRDQARALVRASAEHPIRVIYPMITELEEFQRLRALFEAAIADLPPGQLSHGLMFEVPSACLQALEFFELIDFGCIGTNDLVQYLFATDRTSDRIDCHQLYAHPALWRLIQNLAEAAQRAGKPLSLCGDLASDPRYTKRLIAAGVRVVSASPRNIAPVRRAARGSCS